MLGMSSEPSTQWQEDVAPDEDARFTRLAEQLRELQRRNARSNGAGRALHRKGHVGVEASFEVLDGCRRRRAPSPLTAARWPR